MIRNNKKGYTLVEVLGVIVILLIIALIITPIIVSYLKGAHKDAKDVQDYTLKEAAKSWISDKDNISLMPVIDGDCIEVTLRELKQGGFIDNDIKDPETKELLSDDITLIIRKVGNNLTYEVNNGSQTCNVVVDSTYPRWTYVSSSKTQINKDDTIVVKIKSSENIKENNLTGSSIIVKADGDIVSNAIINNVSCTGTSQVTCEITLSNIDIDGKLNLVIDKNTLVNNDNIKSKVTPILTDVVVDNDGPKIKYVGRENDNSSAIYTKSTNTVVVIFDTLDSNISTDTIQLDGIDIYVNGSVNNNVTKSLTRTSVDGGYRYRLSLGNLTGNGLLTIKIKKDQVSDTLGSKNKDTILNPGITVDNILPEIEFSVDGTTEYMKDVTTIIRATDLNGIKSPIEYTWSTDSTKTTYDQSGSNNKEASLSGVSGDYYLIARACDLAGNCTRKVSNVFKFSNLGPTITFTPNGNSGYETSKTVRVSVTSGGADLDEGTLNYSISQSSEAPATKEFTNNSNISLDNISGTYFIVVRACDVLGNCTKKASNEFNVDGERPKIVYVSKTNTNRTSGKTSEYTTKSDTVTITLEGTDNIAYNDNLSASDITVRVGGTVVNATVSISKTNITKGKKYVVTLTNITGNGALTLSIDNTKVTDNAGNTAAVGTIVPGITVDNTKPTITFGTNGNTTYKKSQSSKISVSDNYSINGDTRKYIWTDSPSTATPNVAYTSGSTYTKDSVTGDYYLKVKTCDEANNCETVTSNVFKIDNTKPTITFGTNGNSTAAKSHSTKINVSDSHAGGDTTTYKYIWSKTPSSANPSTAFTSGTSYSQSSGDGNYYVKAYACDKAGNCDTVTSNAFYLDNTAPTCSFSGENTSWTKNNVTVTATCSDTNGCTSATASNKWTYSSGTHKTESVSYQIADGAGNTATCSKTISVYVDKTAPSTPNCSGPTISGSTATGTAGAASGSTDDVTAAANIKYYYLINNNGSTPANTNSSFTTSKSFTRACGRSYYEYVIAEDGVGNRSAVKYCGATSDGANSYSGWGACSKTCGGGTQTRTNSCALVTTGLSQSCNTQSCCTATTTNFDYTGGVQTFTVPAGCGGSYKLEVWGAQGGAANGNSVHFSPGLGGYAVGYANLTGGTTYYVVVGGAGTSTSGGYNGGGTSYGEGGAGGGATHIGKQNAVLSGTSASNVLIVAGGGGGAGASHASSNVHHGGNGGGVNGGTGNCDNSTGVCSTGGSQTSAGCNGTINCGGFGYGGSVSNSWDGAGGGGGYYGGGAGGNYNGGVGGGGGSGYIGGVTSGSMQSGVRSGNGYARITKVN